MNRYLGSILLVAGCSIGAGMLGAPVATSDAGFIPSSCMFILVWAFMALSGLVLTELVLSYKKEGINLLTLAKDTLGPFGAFTVSITFMFLFYAILTAYILASASLIASIFSLSMPVASFCMALFLYVTLFRGLVIVDSITRVLMLFLAVSYLALVFFGIGHVDSGSLLQGSYTNAFLAIPILVVSFGYHNLIPTLAHYLGGEKKVIFKAICFGSLIPLAIYLLWEFVIFGIVSPDNLVIWKEAKAGGETVTMVLKEASKSLYVTFFSQNFAFFAIATSFLPVAHSFLDFLKDGFFQREKKLVFAYAKVSAAKVGVQRDEVSKEHPAARLVNRQSVAALFVVVPPFIATIFFPHLFLQALDFAGGFCAVLLFGILPVLMVLQRKKVSPESFVVAKTATLLLILFGSLAIMAIEAFHLMGSFS